MEDLKQAANLRNRGRKAVLSLQLAIATMAVLFGSLTFSPAHAQATGGSIFGQAPAGNEVVVTSSSGMSRHIKVRSSGHYRLGSLPLGVYDAVLLENGKEVDSQNNIKLTVGGGAKVDFTCPPEGCKASADSHGN